MFNRILGSSQSMIRLVGVLAIAVVVAGCGAKGNDRALAKLEEQLANKQATLVAVQDEIAETNATIEVLRAEQAASPISQPAATPTKQAIPKGEFHFVPVDIQKEDTGDGWTNYTVLLAAVNDSDKTVYLADIHEDVTIETEEGFQYSGTVSMRIATFDTGSSKQKVALPPGFRSIGTAAGGTGIRPIVVEFQAASSSHPDTVRSTTLGDVSLAEVEKPSFPVSFPLKILPRIESTVIEIPTTGTIVFGEPRIELSMHSTWWMIFPAAFTNESTGYNRSASGTCVLADGSGVFNGNGYDDLFSAGPGQTVLGAISFYAGYQLQPDDMFEEAVNTVDLSEAVLYCYGDDFELMAQVSDPPVVDPQQ